MTDMVTVRGFVATATHMVTYESGVRVTSFRLASTPRRFDRTTGTWVSGETNWYTVACFRELAMNVQCSVKKGEAVIVSGRLKVRQFERKDGSTGTSVDIEAETVGHDLVLGTATYARRGAAAAALPEGAMSEGEAQTGGAQPECEGEPRPEGVDEDGVLDDTLDPGQEDGRAA